MGIFQLEVLNVALLSKSIYVFGNETYSLWRRVVCIKSNIDPFRMLPIINRSIRKSLLNLIGSILDKQDQVSSTVLQGFRPLITNGLNADFWSDNWTSLGHLKDSFYRKFALFVDKL